MNAWQYAAARIRLALYAGWLLTLAACSATQVGLDYKATTITTQPAASKPIVAVGTFNDRRNADDRYLGAIRGGFGNPLKALETVRPVSDIVRDAFVQGLATRGLMAETSDRARFVMTGVVNKFDCSQYIRREANADITISLTEAVTGKVVFTRPIRRADVQGNLLILDAGIFASTDDLRDVAANTLRLVVDEALDGADFAKATRQ